jgi:hypothetical protein
MDIMSGRKNQSMKEAKTIGFIWRDYSSATENEEIIHHDNENEEIIHQDNENEETIHQNRTTNEAKSSMSRLMKSSRWLIN